MHAVPEHIATQTPLDRRAAEDPADGPGKILVVEDHPLTREAMAELLRMFGHSVVVAGDGRAAVAAALRHPPDLIILDVQLPELDGYQVASVLKHNPLTWGIPIIMVTVDGQRESHLRGLEAEVDAYLQKPVDPDELEVRIRVLLRTKRRNEQLERAEDVIFALARAVEAKDAYTEGHLQRMATYAVAIGRQLGLGEDALVALRYGALLHDVGKVGVDEMIIRKDGPLTEDETDLMRQHPLIGERIVAPLRLAAAVGPIVRHHHEQWDGSGYPDGLVGEAIPLGARIVAVADAFDAMTTQRPYNRVVTRAEAAGRLRASAGSVWDPNVVEAFLTWLESEALAQAALLSRAVGDELGVA